MILVHFKKKGFKKVVGTFFSLSFIQGINYLLPLFVFPFVIRKISAELFGEFMFSLAFINYLNLIVDYGFNLSSVRGVASAKNPEIVKGIFLNVFVAKWILLFISIIVFVILVLALPIFSSKTYLLYPLLLIPLSKVFLSDWFFLGKQNMKVIVYINLFSKILLVIFTLFLIKTKKDASFFAWIFSTSFFLSAVASFYFATQKIGKGIWSSNQIKLKRTIKESTPFFLTNLSQSIYLQSSIIVLGIFSTDYTTVGYYSMAEKAVRGIRYLVSPLTQALYPYFGDKFSELSRKSAINKLKQLTFIILPILLIIILAIWVSKNLIVKLIVGDVIPNVVENIKILSLIIILGTLNNIWGVIGLINMKLEKQFSYSLIITAVFNIISICIGAYFLKDKGVAWAVVATEFTLSILLLFNLNKYRNT